MGYIRINDSLKYGGGWDQLRSLGRSAYSNIIFNANSIDNFWNSTLVLKHLNTADCIFVVLAHDAEILLGIYMTSRFQWIKKADTDLTTATVDNSDAKNHNCIITFTHPTTTLTGRYIILAIDPLIAENY